MPAARQESHATAAYRPPAVTHITGHHRPHILDYRRAGDADRTPRPAVAIAARRAVGRAARWSTAHAIAHVTFAPPEHGPRPGPAAAEAVALAHRPGHSLLFSSYPAAP